MSTTQEFILQHYPLAHKPETGKPMSRQQLLLLTHQLEKERYSDSEILDWLLYFDTLGKPVTQRAACKWMCDAVITLPEDAYKVLQAVKVAKIHHVDPLTYESPMRVIANFPQLKKSGKAIDPSTVNTLHFRYHNPVWDIDVYDVDEGVESRINMRNIINTHLGINSNPWCLLCADKHGNLAWSSHGYWYRYHGLKKRVAFQHGHLYAFSAGRCHPRVWYDRMDEPHKGEKIEYRAIENDRLNRCALYRVDPFTGEKELMGDIHRGNKTNGLYERFHYLRSKRPYSSIYYWNGKPLQDIWGWLTEEEQKELFQKSDFEQGIIRIPSTIQRIPDCAFAFSKALTEIVFPDHVEHMGRRVLEGCTNLLKVRLPSNLSCIPEGMFRDCSSLRQITLPVSLKEIGKNAFSHCAGLMKIRFPKGLRVIGEGAFLGCRSLSTIRVPRSVKTIGKGSFSCSNLDNVTIPDTIREIHEGAFSMCPNIRSFTVCKRWYGMFRKRYGRRVHLLDNTDNTLKQCA